MAKMWKEFNFKISFQFLEDWTQWNKTCEEKESDTFLLSPLKNTYVWNRRDKKHQKEKITEKELATETRKLKMRENWIIHKKYGILVVMNFNKFHLMKPGKDMDCVKCGNMKTVLYMKNYLTPLKFVQLNRQLFWSYHNEISLKFLWLFVTIPSMWFHSTFSDSFISYFWSSVKESVSSSTIKYV